MPVVIPTLYLVKSMVPKNSYSKLPKFQLKKIVSFMSIVLVTNNLTSNISHNDNNKLSYDNDDIVFT